MSDITLYERLRYFWEPNGYGLKKGKAIIHTEAPGWLSSRGTRDLLYISKTVEQIPTSSERQ